MHKFLIPFIICLLLAIVSNVFGNGNNYCVGKNKQAELAGIISKSKPNLDVQNFITNKGLLTSSLHVNEAQHTNLSRHHVGKKNPLHNYCFKIFLIQPSWHSLDLFYNIIRIGKSRYYLIFRSIII